MAATSKTLTKDQVMAAIMKVISENNISAEATELGRILIEDEVIDVMATVVKFFAADLKIDIDDLMKAEFRLLQCVAMSCLGLGILAGRSLEKKYAES